jgi:hypothetical protein
MFSSPTMLLPLLMRSSSILAQRPGSPAFTPYFHLCLYNILVRETSRICCTALAYCRRGQQILDHLLMFVLFGYVMLLSLLIVDSGSSQGRFHSFLLTQMKIIFSRLHIYFSLPCLMSAMVSACIHKLRRWTFLPFDTALA